LAQAGVEYEDVRVEREDWPALKPTMPMGQIPVLEMDGHKLCQSVAMGRYLARKHNLTGASDFEAAQCDMYVDGAQDLIPKLRPAVMAWFAGDKAKMKEEMDELMKEAMPTFLKAYEKFLTENGTGWLVGKQVTWADLWVGEMLARLSEPTWLPGMLDGYPQLKAFVDKVHALPAIKAWVAKRPETGF